MFAAIATLVVVSVVLIGHGPNQPLMSDEQKEAHKALFGSDKDLPPITKGQEMQPRW
jgi:Ti type entry exclusion protein TrbK